MTRQELITLYEAKICPCCGTQLDFEPWSGDGRFQSDEICPCCGIQFGYKDFTGIDDLDGRILEYESVRVRWVKEGMMWRHSHSKPDPWDPREQLRRVQKEADPDRQRTTRGM
jgi:RNA polymerase subunit RPABC4/transcription elongation factor Spt4